MKESSSLPDGPLSKSEPPVQLEEHSGDVSKYTEQLLGSPVILRRLRASGAPSKLTLETVQELGALAGQLHDVGKAHPDWQEACRAYATEGESDGFQFPPHSARSALHAFATSRERGLSPYQGVAVTLAILHHHTPLTSNRMRREQIKGSVGDLSALEGMVTSLEGTRLPRSALNAEIRDSFLGAVAHYHSLEPREDEQYQATGTLVTLLRAALVQADHHVSARVSGGRAPLPSTLDPTDISLFENLRPFQSLIDEVEDGRLVGLAGCGEGKTHSALQWGKEMIEDSRANRLVFAMPTQVTTNNLLLSLTGGATGDAMTHIPPDGAALYHSASQTFYEGDVATERWDLSDVSLDMRARRWFQRPVTVTTVDHVLSTLVNGYDWASLSRGNLLQGAVIFDELHAYDEHTTGHILGAIRTLDRAGVPWHVMSATIPPQIREHETLDGATGVTSEGRLNDELPPREPFVISVEQQSLDAETVLSRVEENAARRIMVVRNTVGGARELARELMDAGEDVVYYSSAFTQNHREQKEEEIRRRFGGGCDSDSARQFLVCTQVCEISLDLSADLLLTDIAPIDAIVQRAGRLHRSGVAPTSEHCRELRGDACPQCVALPPGHQYECVVYAPLEGREQWLPYAAQGEVTEWSLLERTRDVLSQATRYRFDRSLTWVDEAYEGLPIEYETLKLSRTSREDWLYGDARRVAPDADSGREDLKIRDISTYKRAVFMEEYSEPDGTTWAPTERWQDEHDCPRAGRCGLHTEEHSSCDNEFRQFATQYTVEIPQWWLQDDDHPVSVVGTVADTEGYQIASVEYTYELGADPR